jgi:menaquinol-cytochrome c reductase cytochrome b/c subunit
MRRWVIGGLSALALAGCGSGSPPARTAPGDPSTINIAPPAALDTTGRADFLAGRTVAAESGCMACHTIGVQGNPGPGADLTHVGSRLTTAQLLKAMRSPPAPMPSYALLAPSLLTNLVTFLHDLQ